MSVIIGSLTAVNIGGATDGIQSAQWATQVQPNRLWELGSWDTYKTQVTKMQTASITAYAGVVGSFTLSPSISCADSGATKNVSITAASCGSGSSVNFVPGDMFLMSYSYSKGDPTTFGTESWSFQLWVATTLGGEFINVGAPTYVLQGKAEGSKSGDVPNLGVTLIGGTIVTGNQGSVSAGFPGIGQADDTEYGLVSAVGGGSLEASGKIGQSSASIPHSPLYLG